MEIYLGKQKLSFTLWIIILIIFVFWLMSAHLFCSCSKVTPFEAFHLLKEGYSNMNGGGSFSRGLYGGSTGDFYANYPSKPIDYEKWNQPNIGTTGSPSWQKVVSYKNTKLPLRDGQMFLFAQTDFKPECCNPSNTFSLSTGCACMNLDTTKYLWERGGNNVPYVPGASI